MSEEGGRINGNRLDKPSASLEAMMLMAGECQGEGNIKTLVSAPSILGKQKPDYVFNFKPYMYNTPFSLQCLYV